MHYWQVCLHRPTLRRYHVDERQQCDDHDHRQCDDHDHRQHPANTNERLAQLGTSGAVYRPYADFLAAPWGQAALHLASRPVDGGVTIPLAADWKTRLPSRPQRKLKVSTRYTSCAVRRVPKPYKVLQ